MNRTERLTREDSKREETERAARAFERLTELTDGWDVKIERDRDDFIVTVTSVRPQGGNRNEFTYRDADLCRALARAHAGEPS